MEHSMELRTWKSFSCNNSSSYYLVATFETNELAVASVEELAAFLKAHAAEIDKSIVDNNYTDTLEPSEAERSLSKKHDFELKGYLRWGDEALSDWLPDVTAIGSEVVIHHRYCGSFPETIPRYFEAVGAKPGASLSRSLLVSALVVVPDGDGGERLRKALGDYFASFVEEVEDAEGYLLISDEQAPPWGDLDGDEIEFECGEPFPYFEHADQLGFAFPVVQPRDSQAIVRYLESFGVSDFRVALDRYDQLDKFRAIASASCTACGTAEELRFLDALDHGLPVDQLACKKCGGMFALPVVEPAPQP